ncbi:AAA family ATPase [Candidatus Poriferisocius sp.]|uniref:AAA family ATPase n=1 Tax=Candidatus Poriferisocius sp. TaxID=3101276 RepID=UPI003B02CF24
MLLRFQVSNHRSILDPVELSMIAVDDDRPATRGFDRLSERVLTTTGIYGPNASGKSNVLDALHWLSCAVATSLLAGGDSIARDPHRFGKGPDQPSTFELDFVLDGVRHGYQLEVDDSAVRYESLCSYPERRRRMLFEREGDEVHFRRGLSGTGGTKELLTPTTLVLSAGKRVGDPAIKAAGRAVSGIAEINARGFNRRRGRSPIKFAIVASDTYSQFEDAGIREQQVFGSVTRGEAAMGLLRLADPGITDFDIVELEDRTTGDTHEQLVFVHHDGDRAVKFWPNEESAGTQMLFSLLGPALEALRQGQVLLFDEADASLHPRLSARLVELFQDRQTNPHGAQLILATHDTSLLSTLNRDEVWLTEKGSNGATSLVALAEFGGDKVRRSLNLERAYLQGRFGAVPEIDHIDVRQAFGLAGQAT